MEEIETGGSCRCQCTAALLLGWAARYLIIFNPLPALASLNTCVGDAVAPLLSAKHCAVVEGVEVIALAELSPSPLVYLSVPICEMS
jgi:hypothetical protein